MRHEYHASALAALFLLSITNVAFADPEMTFKLVGVNSVAGAKFQTQMQDARAKVRAWWGATFEEKIAIETTPDRMLSMALTPAWRGERGSMSFGSKRVDDNQAASIHEMIHVYAPNANRMLAEGLAVYGHEHLGGNAAYPTFGKDLHRVAAASAGKDVLLKLERAATPAALEDISKDGEALSGSFVRFLIEKHGMEKFRALYDLTPLMRMKREAGAVERWQTIYGQPLDALVDGWLAAIK
jgi:hypothetical protein